MLALNAQCELFETLGRKTDLEATARTLRVGLTSGAWSLGGDAYDFYAEAARRWSGQPAETDEERHARAVATAFDATYRLWADGAAPQRQWFAQEEPLSWRRVLGTRNG